MRLGIFELLFLAVVAIIIYSIVRAKAGIKNSLICPRCGKLMPPDAFYCMYCGTVIRSVEPGVACASCGNIGPADASFCRKCGDMVKGKVV